MEIEGYEELVEIGRGGYAVVYRARQPRFDRQVAIKVMTAPGFGETDRARFEREALAMGRLSWHPHIVVVHETGTTDSGLPYLIEEFVEGGSLGERVRDQGPLPVGEALAATIQLCAAAHTAHEADLLHRDIKPDNALVDALGRIKLTDFGIAAVTGSTLTATGLVTATIAHAAPEVLNGKRATTAADVYSLGSTLYELLVGSPAFTRETDESIVPMVVRATTEPVPDLRARGIPEPVVAAVEAAMAKEPTERPPSALEYGRLLQEAEAALGLPVTPLAVRAGTAAAAPAAGDDTVAHPVVPVAPPPDPGATVAGAVVTPDPTPPPPPPVAESHVTAPEVPVAAADPAVTHRDQPAVGAVTDETAAVPVVGGAAAPPGAPSAEPERKARGGRGVLVAVVAVLLVLVAGGYLVTRDGDTDGADAGGGSGSGGGGGGEVAEPDEAVVVETGDRPFRIAVTPEAAWVTNAEGGTVSRLDPTSGEVVATVDIGGEVIGVGADAEAAWVADTDVGTLVRLPVDGGDPSSVAVGAQPRIVALTPTDAWVTLLGENSVARVDRASGTVVATIPVGRDPRGLVVDGDDVWVTNYADGTVSRIDAAGNTVVATVPVGGNPVNAVVADAGVWVADPGTDSLILIDPEADAEADRITGVGDGPNGMALAGDDLFVSMAGDNEVIRFDAATGEARQAIPAGTAPAGLAVFEGTLWVADSEDDTVRLIPLG